MGAASDPTTCVGDPVVRGAVVPWLGGGRAV